MAVWVDPFTGQKIDTDILGQELGQKVPAPLGGPYPKIPGGTSTFQGDPNTMGIPLTSDVEVGGKGYIPGYGFEADRGKTFYMPGDEWKIISSQSNLTDLQQSLEDAGVLGPNYLKGAPDEATAEAMRRVLASANAAGLSWDEVLRSARDEALKSGKGRERAPLVIELMSDEDLRSVLQAGAQTIYGKYVQEGDVQKFVDAYHSQQISSQTTAYNMGTAGAVNTVAGAVSGPPTSGAGINRQFETQFAAEHPTEARTGIFASKLDEFLSALSGGGPRVNA